jgi:hypothetical protein
LISRRWPVTYLHVVFYLFIFLVGFRFSVPTGAAG